MSDREEDKLLCRDLGLIPDHKLEEAEDKAPREPPKEIGGKAKSFSQNRDTPGRLCQGQFGQIRPDASEHWTQLRVAGKTAAKQDCGLATTRSEESGAAPAPGTETPWEAFEPTGGGNQDTTAIWT